jgi:hypothetical protein
MSFPNIQQKKSLPRNREADDVSKVLGTGEEQQFFYQAVHQETDKIYKKAKMKYRNSADQDAEEMFMDKIMTPDGEFVVERQVVVMVRQKGMDMQEWLRIHEQLFGRTPLGNPQRYMKQEDISEHDEPEIEQRMVPGSGESIRKKGESVLYHKTKFDIKFSKENLADAMKRVKEPLALQLYVKEEGQRGWRVRDRHAWENYEWDDLIKFCKTRKTPEMTKEEALGFLGKASKEFSIEDKRKIMEYMGVLDAPSEPKAKTK